MSLKYNSVYIDNKEYTVKKYNEIKKKNPKSIIFNYDIFNKNGKQLEYVESKQGKFRSHFRIRHNQEGTTNPMTDWHCLWGNYF